MPRKPAIKVEDQAPSTCASCRFCLVNADSPESYDCWVDPPDESMLDGEISFVRGKTTMLKWPACRHFQPRLNS